MPSVALLNAVRTRSCAVPLTPLAAKEPQEVTAVLRQKGLVAASRPSTVPVVGVVETSEARPVMVLPP